MVMEAPPSPQSVGREFVRQYYTLLNKAPTHLHRFYNHQSSFIHGGLDPNRETSPVVGQKQIHQKIQQLNFRDCHAKITQVDSQSTLGGGVVVQVTGELSNAGQPMRRFTQTFVLASQSPKKFYVHNDIFRYQDEIITDEDCDGDIRSEVEDDSLERAVLVEPQQPLGQPIAPAPGLPYYGNAVPPTGNALPSLGTQPPTAAPHQGSHILPPAQVPISQAPPAAVALNGHPDDLGLLQGHISQSVQQPLVAPLPNLPNQGLGNQPPVATPVDELQESEELVEETIIDGGGYGDVAETELEQEIPQEPASNEPKTYANLLKNTNSNHNQLTYQTPPQTLPYRPQSPPRSTPQTNGVTNRGSGGPRLPSGPPSRVNGPGYIRGNRSGDEGDYDRRRSQSSNFGGQLDANQLFLGNLPHTATEDELRDIFSDYGMIVDLRVHSKPPLAGSKPNQGGRAPPNYGFITYESQQSVAACLAARPIYYPKNDPSGTQMNVEEKKNKERDGGRQSYGGNGGRPGIDNNRSGGRGDASRRMGSGGPRVGPGGPQDRNRTGDRDNRFNRSGGGGGGGPLNRGGPNNYNRR
ncbi:ras GTPase-activating protein-binding protein 1 isoform X1 [Euwallacea similis]|uniref:ras GTPase-activating protein-binding protein 1 isoform X1 n=1 Tax=Euwallacea similis TaxID=1736056 RepID=UPI0034505617